jgi:hypothetical protein
MKPVRFHPDADTEMLDAAVWYEDQQGDLVEWFRSRAEAQGSGNYQTMLNDSLREFTKHQDASLEKLLRKVVREELKKASCIQMMMNRKSRRFRKSRQQFQLA